MAQNLQIRRAPSGIVISEKAVSFLKGSNITLNNATFTKITDMTIGLVEDADADQLSLVSFTANVAGDFVLNTGSFEAQLRFEPVTTGPSVTSTRAAVVVVFSGDFIFVALNGSGTFGATPDGQIKVSLEMKTVGTATGVVKPTDAGFTTVFAAITF